MSTFSYLFACLLISLDARHCDFFLAGCWMFLTSSKLSLALFWDTGKHFDPFGSCFHDLLGMYGALFSLKVIIPHSRAKTAWVLHPLPNWSRLNIGHLRISGPSLWNLQILPYKEKMVYADVIKYFAMGKLSWIILNGWVLNPITSFLLKERQNDLTRAEEKEAMWPGKQRLK